jgi:protein-disulfide isomerase
MPVNQEQQHNPSPVNFFLLTCLFFLATACSQSIAAEASGFMSLKSQLLAIDPLRDHIRGNIDAELSLIEYADFNCPYCRRFHPAAKQLIKTSGGNVNWVYRHFPLGARQANTRKLAEAAECVAEIGGKNAFWYFTDSLIMQPKRGRDLQNNAENNLPTGVEKAAKLARIDSTALAACINSGRHAPRVQADSNNALQMGLIGTPASIIINNRTGQLLLRQGAASLKTLKADIATLTTPAIAQ